VARAVEIHREQYHGANENKCSIKAQSIEVSVANLKNCPGVERDGLRRHVTATSAGILVSWDAEMPHGGITSRDRTAVIQSLTSKFAGASIACPFRLNLRAPGFGEVQ
jgi:hypothetical protein